MSLYKGIQDYIDLVRSGKYRVCIEQIQLINLIEKTFATEDLFINEEQAEKYFSYQKYFPYKLFEWERFCFTLHNCVYRQDGELRFPDLFCYLGRGSGKNGYLSFENFCLLTETNGIWEYDIDMCANSEKQAKTTFMEIYTILESNKNFWKRYFKWNLEQITYKKTNSTLRYYTKSPNTKDGLKSGKVDFDELHAYLVTDLIDVFSSGLGKKKHPRRTFVSSDGYVREGVLDTYLNYCREVLSGLKPLGEMIPFICRIEARDEMDDELNWYKANPSLQYLKTVLAERRRMYSRIKSGLSQPTEFLTKCMNFPVATAECDVTDFENLRIASRAIDVALEGLPCIWGIDYASIRDFASTGLLFRVGEVYYWLHHSWACAKNPHFKDIKITQTAVAEGSLTVVDEDEIDPELIIDWAREKAIEYNILGVNLDNFKFSIIGRPLRREGFTMKNRNLKLVRPSDQMRVAMQIERLFESGKICWGENSAIMRWFTNNTKRVDNNRGAVYYGKKEPVLRKTDGFMALVAAFATVEKLDADDDNNASLPEIKLISW